MTAEIVDILKMVWPLIVLQYALVIWALVDLARRPKCGTAESGLGDLILFVNFFGAIGYLVFGREEA